MVMRVAQALINKLYVDDVRNCAEVLGFADHNNRTPCRKYLKNS
jgi:hypothetical protein